MAGAGLVQLLNKLGVKEGKAYYWISAYLNHEEAKETEQVSKVYFIQESGTGCIKIGRAFNVKSRLKDLQTANPNQLTLLGKVLGDSEVETRIHKKFKHLHKRGEWFCSAQELIDFIRVESD